MSRSWEECYKDDFQIITYSNVYEEQSMEVLRKSFFLNESVCIGSEINKTIEAQREMEQLCKETVEDGVSLLAMHKPSGKIVGVSFNKIQQLPPTGEQAYFEVFRDNQCRTENAKSLMQFMIDMDSKIDMFATYNIDCLFEVMFLAVLPDYGQNGIGRKLVENSTRLAQFLNNGGDLKELAPNLSDKRPKAVSAIFTSRFSQKVGSSLGFKTLAEVAYSDFTFKGKTYADRIGSQHPSSLLVIKLL